MITGRRLSSSRWHSGQKAIVALFRDLGTNDPCGIHRTFLAADATKFLIARGVGLKKMSDDMAAEVQKKVKGVSGQWAKNLDDRGKPGTKVLEAFLTELAKR